LYELEAEYAHSHKDLPARLFLCAGDEEMTARTMALAEVASGVARFTELFAIRGYPSLVVESQIMERESHLTLHPRALVHGLLHVFTPPSPVVNPAPPVNKDDERTRCPPLRLRL
jgi:hypothetical protein